MFFFDWSISNMRLLAMISHFVLTTGKLLLLSIYLHKLIIIIIITMLIGLYWTKIDSIQVGMIDYTDRHEYYLANTQYSSLIIFGLIFIIVEFISYGITYENIDILCMMHLFLDIVGCFTVSWIILDGLDWRTYIYIFVFCVMVPCFLDILQFVSYIASNRWISTNDKRSIAMRLYYNWCVRR